MAGMLPGVGVPPRRRIHSHHRQESGFSRSGSPPWEWRAPSAPVVCTLDETTLRARQRLEKRLGYLNPSSRSMEVQSNIDRSLDLKEHTKESPRSAKKLLAKHWNFRLSRSKSERNICSVCLEEFQAEQAVMDLSCSHKYHSDCLLPWLADHPHCPYCRIPIHS
ncbi:E3 ubiquitin-protein ligase RNF181-like [Mangifera indica]|uniref:E3 ubiquitin-protein ligase RNF181-like n=1 Tax=Mangifera indica TaxID=29780 RepID=UPI001CFB33C2|nr:E3 ubiquitin-protein ligase RNF181-like [Mangifera indica]